MKWVKGEHYDHLLEEFVNNGGDLSECPFDTKDKEGSLTGPDDWEREYQEIIKKSR